jgi:hypothetical protein
MKLYSAQKLEMQIPEGNNYTGMNFMVKNDDKLEQFLKNHFKFPSCNLNDIKNFISKDCELEKIIYDLPNIISKQLNYNKISLDFMKETDSNEKILEIIIYSESESKILLQKENLICDTIINKYPKTILEYIILVDPYERQ